MADMIVLFLFYGLVLVVMSILVVAFSAIGAWTPGSFLALVFALFFLLQGLLRLIERIFGKVREPLDNVARNAR